VQFLPCVISHAAPWIGCVSWDRYYGKVVALLPRSVTLPGVLLWSLSHGYYNALDLIDVGSYQLSRM